VPSASETVTTVDRYRLLGHPGDLAGHVAALGPVPLPEGSNLRWREGFAAALEASGLAGRGGANFPAAIKLAVAHAGGRGGSIVVNAMEGEPASDKDKLLLLRSPHLVLDGAQLLAAACEAARVTVCIPTGRDHVAAAVSAAMAERAAAGCSPVPETLVRPPDRFVAGEESALVGWVRSGASLPTFRPDKGVPLRIGRRSLLVQNAETLAHVAMIARVGPEAFRARGVVEEPGTSLVTISGAVEQAGVVEVDRGTPLAEIAARATPSGPIRALLVGGYGGSWVGPADFPTPYASISLRTIGATAGVGVVVVLGADACGVAESARIARYMAEQSSGQCGPCVHGLPAIADDMAHLARGQVDAHLVERLGRRLAEVNGRGACRHPDGAVTMVRSALSVFAVDVGSHVRGAPCPHWNRPTALRFPHRPEVA
jgi:NADH:ubiquinone oxidoreductase subunit F (NADH-binding)